MFNNVLDESYLPGSLLFHCVACLLRARHGILQDNAMNLNEIGESLPLCSLSEHHHGILEFEGKRSEFE